MQRLDGVLYKATSFRIISREQLLVQMYARRNELAAFTWIWRLSHYH